MFAVRAENMSIRPIRERKSVEQHNENMLMYVVGERLELECAAPGTPQLELLWSCKSFAADSVGRSADCEGVLCAQIWNAVRFEY